MKVKGTSWIKGVVLVGIGIAIGVAMPGAQPSSAKEMRKVEPVKIGYVNIAKVLSEFGYANAKGAEITNARQENSEKIRTDKELLEKLEKEYADAQAGDQRLKAMEANISAVQKRIVALEGESKGRLAELANTVIVDVYSQIRSTISELAKDYGFDVVEAFPASTKPEHEKTPAVAQLMLQTPALIPFYLNPERDVSDEVIERLNKKFPREKDVKPGK